MYTKFIKISCSFKKKLLWRVDQIANIKKENSKTWSEEATNNLTAVSHMNACEMLLVMIIKTETESLFF